MWSSSHFTLFIFCNLITPPGNPLNTMIDMTLHLIQYIQTFQKQDVENIDERTHHETTHNGRFSEVQTNRTPS